MVAGSTALLVLSVVLTGMYLSERSGGNTAEMLFRADAVWYAPLHIAYSVGVDGISVAMLAECCHCIYRNICFVADEGTNKRILLLVYLLSMGVFGFFICIDLFTMFMFYEIALIPMYLLIGVWGSAEKNIRP
jgi:NADH-quinone oxidoreductase subunit M